jgi:hypothetical protein
MLSRKPGGRNRLIENHEDQEIPCFVQVFHEERNQAGTEHWFPFERTWDWLLEHSREPTQAFQAAMGGNPDIQTNLRDPAKQNQAQEGRPAQDERGLD